MILRRIGFAVVTLLAGACGSALADPALRVEFQPIGVRLALDGSFPGSTYTVLRAESPSGAFRAITSANVLCVGECFAWDSDAVPGRTEYYRFDLFPSGGEPVQFGPYAVAIPRASAAVRVSPNPSRAQTRIDVTLPGGTNGDPATARVTILDPTGRAIRTLHSGVIPRAGLTLAWDGRDDRGLTVRPGIYLVHTASARDVATARIVRIR